MTVSVHHQHGNNREQVLASLRACRTGIEYYPPLERSGVPVRLAGTVKGFTFPELRPDEWTYPEGYKIPREQLRSMAPNVLYAFCAMQQAIADAHCRQTWFHMAHRRDVRFGRLALAPTIPT